MGQKFPIAFGLRSKGFMGNAPPYFLPFLHHATCFFRKIHTSDTTKFDLVFIDADKKEYCDYLDLVLPLMQPGGWILADNTLWDGHIIDPAYDKDRQTVALRAFNDKVAQDPRLEKVILPLRDGLTIIRVK